MRRLPCLLAMALISAAVVVPWALTRARAVDEPPAGEWVSLLVRDGEAGNEASEYFGRLDRQSLGLLRNGEFKGFVKLDQVFSTGDDDGVERLADSDEYAGVHYLRADRITRISPLKKEFVAKAFPK